MNPATISFLVLFGLAFLCFLIPYKSGQKATGKVTGSILGVLITLTLIGNLNYLTVFIYPIIAIFQVIFITYWTFRFFGKRTAGKITTIILTSFFIYLILSPWISDWMFNKKDARKILSFHSIELNDDFKIIENEAGGFRDYYETFRLKVSDKDLNNISHAIKTSKNYKGLFTDYSNEPSANYKTKDTVDFETETHFEREYWSSKKMENGTYHFRFQLGKKDKVLNYIGSDE